MIRWNLNIELGITELGVHNINSDWQEKYKELCRFHLDYHWGNMKNSFPDLNLIQWLQQQRNSMEYLTDQQLQLLESIGFIWDIRAIKFTEEKGMEFAQQFLSEN